MVVLQVAQRLSALGPVERRLGNVEMAALDQLRHLPEEEGEQERADVAAVHIGVGHDDDLVVAQLIDVELVATDAGAERRYQSPDLLRRQLLFEARPLAIKDFAAQLKKIGRSHA